MPVYNVEKYLRHCLDSILSQTFTKFELIAVDDGSTDASSDILAEYSQKDSRVCIIKMGHSNAGKCRNVGMAHAKGEYLVFLDSDDVFSPNLLEVLLNGAEMYCADVACCKYLEFADGEKAPLLSANKDVEWKDCTLDCARKGNFDIATGCTWNKLYRHKYIVDSNLTYVEQPTTNDVTFVWAAIANATKVISTDAALVAYRRRKNSLQDTKSRHPECAIVANRRFAQEMVRLKVFERRPWVHDYYRIEKPGGYVDYLSTLRTRNAYMTAYWLIREELTRMWRPDDLLAHRNDRYTRRACGIIKNSLKERFQRNLESTMSPFLGQGNYAKGIKRKLIICIRHLMMLMFDFGPTMNLIVTRLRFYVFK